MSLKIWTYPGNYRVQKAQICAKYCDVSIEEVSVTMGVTNKSPEFLKMNPLGKVPTLQTPEGPIWESDAIARYVASLRPDKQLLGKTFYDAALVNQWILFCGNEFEPSRCVCIYPILGYLQYNEAAHKIAMADVTKACAILDQHLLENTYLVGNAITLADITIVCALVTCYTKLFEPAFVGKFPSMTRWFKTCVQQPHFASVLGKIDFLVAPAKAPAAKAAATKATATKAPAAKPAATKAPEAKASTVASSSMSPELEKKLADVGNRVRELKAAKADPAEIKAAVAELLALKAEAGIAAPSKSDKKKAEKAAKKAKK